MPLVRISILFAGFVLFLFPGDVFGQQHQAHSHNHPVLRTIDQAHKEGKLSLDERVLYKFYVLKSPSKLPGSFQSQSSEPVKCGTPIFADYQRNKDQLSQLTIREIEAMATRSQPSETFTSSSGNFLIHYETTGDDAVPSTDTSGVNGVPDYVELVAAAADSSWRYQVQQLGFTDPILESSPYEVTIRDLGAGFYGLTRGLANTSEIEIHNDFMNGFPPNDHPDGDQIGAIYVTMAHEFKHAVQYENNRWQGSAGSFGWIEIDATLMEEVTYDNVNDYYNYITVSGQSIFLNPSQSIPGAYWDVSFSIFFDEFFGTQFWVDVWQQEIKPNPTMDFLDAIKSQLTQRGEEFSVIFAEMYMWHYASGLNSTPGYGFEERENYPGPAIDETIQGTQQSLNNAATIEANAANYFVVNPSGNESNQVRIDFSADTSHYTAGLIAYFKNGTSRILFNASANGTISFETLWSWKDIDKIGIVIANTDEANDINADISTRSYDAQLVTLRQNYPNPFSDVTTIEFELLENSNVQLKIYDITGRLVRTLIDGPRSAGIHTPMLSSDRLASGVYFYRLKTDQRRIVKKLTLIK